MTSHRTPSGKEEFVIPPSGGLDAFPRPLAAMVSLTQRLSRLDRKSLWGLCVRVSVCTVCMMSTLPHAWELRHRTAPELCGWVTTSVAVAAQESWPVGERSFSFQACCVGLRGDTQLPLSLVLPVWGQKTFQLLWNVQKVLCSRAVWPWPRSCTQGTAGELATST